MGYKRVDVKTLTRVEYSFRKFTILIKSSGSQLIDDVVVQYYNPNNGVPVQVDMTRDDLGDLLALLGKMQSANEIHIPTDYVTN